MFSDRVGYIIDEAVSVYNTLVRAVSSSEEIMINEGAEGFKALRRKFGYRKTWQVRYRAIKAYGNLLEVLSFSKEIINREAAQGLEALRGMIRRHVMNVNYYYHRRQLELPFFKYKNSSSPFSFFASFFLFVDNF